MNGATADPCATTISTPSRTMPRMIGASQTNLGRVLKYLDNTGLAENTVVVYFSDNGPNSFRWNGGMKGRKGSIDEGGLRSPFFMRWPGRIRSW